MTKNIIIILLILTGLYSPSYSQDIDLFIWAGQSNAQGRQGDAAGYPVDTDNLDDQIRFNWTRVGSGNSGGWVTMGAQNGIFAAGHFGPEVTFSRNLKQAEYNPAIFKYTRGNTSIFEDWRTPGNGGIYDDMVTDLNTAITELEDLGHTVNIKGFIWIQGEADSDGDNSANAYFNNLTSIISDIRSIANNGSLPVILGVDEQYPGMQDRRQVLNAHQNIALNDANIKFTSMYGYPKADVTHLTPAGIISHGNGIFGTFEILAAGSKPSSDCTLASTGDVVSILTERSWGQSFTTDCSGQLATLIFSAASDLANSATVTLHNGANCTGTILFTETLNSIATGDNSVSISDNIYLEKEHTYYLNITSSTATGWKIHYSSSTNVFGNLTTSEVGANDLSCERDFPSFDMNFSVEISQSVLGVDWSADKLIKLYPNPSDGNIHLFLGDEAHVSVKVFNILGELVYQKDRVGSQFNLDKKPGLYLVHIILEDGTRQLHRLLLR